ncbi:hypothetical protein KIW84_021642 [Lathyrus oleraceus]|uniref:Uncharacterized protein n=1 Tax=Pisum sativum TaxID=3888 RepID=A0A9D4Y940_PEA|nr:hypothetical protein KIW84_021642 [Pisum sativum]
MRIEDRELKQLRGKEIALVKVAWGGPTGGNVTWELESQMKESYPEEAAEKRKREKRQSKRKKVGEEKSLRLKDCRINSVISRTYSFLRNRNRRSGSPPTAENAENSAFCFVLAQEQLSVLR